MKYKITTPIIDYENKTLKISDDEGKPTEKEKTFRDVCYEALNKFLVEEKPTSETTQQCYQLTHRIWSNDEIELTLDQVAFIKGRIKKIFSFSPLILGRSGEFFEPKTKKEKERMEKEKEKAAVEEPAQDPE